MGAKKSAEMKLAEQLVDQGIGRKEAARTAGVNLKSLYRNRRIKPKHGRRSGRILR